MNKWVKELIPYVVTLLIVILIKMFIVTPIKVDGTSMYSTLHDKDWMILNRLAFKISDIKRFDIVVIKKNNKEIIKRVIALPGEDIKVIDNVLYINNKEVKETFLPKNTKTENFTLKELLKIERIPKDKYFVMGDNRGDSLDSRIIGLIDKDEIEGKASVTIYPFNRWGTKR